MSFLKEALNMVDWWNPRTRTNLLPDSSADNEQRKKTHQKPQKHLKASPMKSKHGVHEEPQQTL